MPLHSPPLQDHGNSASKGPQWVEYGDLGFLWRRGGGSWLQNMSWVGCGFGEGHLGQGLLPCRRLSLSVHRLHNISASLSASAIPFQRHYAKPTQLHFYPGAWQDVLKQAKEFYCLWVIKDCPFPVRESHLLQACLCLKKAMEEFEKKGHEVKTGMSKYTFISHSHEYDQVILTSTLITCFFWSVIYFTINFIFHLY